MVAHALIPLCAVAQCVQKHKTNAFIYHHMQLASANRVAVFQVGRVALLTGAIVGLLIGVTPTLLHLQERYHDCRLRPPAWRIIGGSAASSSDSLPPMPSALPALGMGPVAQWLGDCLALPWCKLAAHHPDDPLAPQPVPVTPEGTHSSDSAVGPNRRSATRHWQLQFCVDDSDCGQHSASPEACKGRNSAAENTDGAGPHCRFDGHTKRCVSSRGSWDGWLVGAVASLPTVGGLAGSLLFGLAASQPSKFATAMYAAALFAAASVTVLLSSWWAGSTVGHPSVVGVLIGQGLQGMAVGGLCVVVPPFVASFVPGNARSVLGTVFQVSLTFGIALSALILVVLQSSGTAFEGVLALTFALVAASLWALRRQQRTFSANNWTASFFAVGSTSGASGTAAATACSGATTISVPVGSGAGGEPNMSFFAVCRLIARQSPTVFVATALLLPASNQLTGINAVMNFAPRISQAVGLDPAMGTLLVMTWNFVTAVTALPLVQRVPTRLLYRRTLIAASLANLLIALVLLPGLFQEGAAGFRTFVYLVGVGGFIAAFEIGIGPLFFVLATELFPPAYRSVGCTLTTTSSFAMNLVVTFFFPVVVGYGTTTDPDKGMRYCFIFFAVFGLFCAWLMHRGWMG